MDNIQNMIEKIIIEHSKAVNDAIITEMKRISAENCIETTFCFDDEKIASALKKQIPGKVHISPKDITTWNTKFHCPVCLEDIIGGQKYCHHCGQLLDWGIDNG